VGIFVLLGLILLDFITNFLWVGGWGSRSGQIAVRWSDHGHKFGGRVGGNGY
jgi:hypothetical protein